MLAFGVCGLDLEFLATSKVVILELIFSILIIMSCFMVICVVLVIMSE